MNIYKKPILMVVVSHLETLERLLMLFRSREPMVDVVGVESSEKALEFAVHYPISAVVVDEHMGDMSGFELLAMIKKVRSEVTALIMLSPSSPQRQLAEDQIPGISVVPKTTDLEQLVSRIASHLSEKEVGFRGIIDNLELPDILQLICLRGESKQVRISSDMHSGIIMIQDGQVVHARTQSSQGEEAFFDLFGWKGGAFQIQQLGAVPKRTIHKPWESLLLEAGQLLDERSGEHEKTLNEEPPASAPEPGAQPSEPPSPQAGDVSSGDAAINWSIDGAAIDEVAALARREPAPEIPAETPPQATVREVAEKRSSPAAEAATSAPSRPEAPATPVRAKTPRTPAAAQPTASPRRRSKTRRTPRPTRSNRRTKPTSASRTRPAQKRRAYQPSRGSRSRSIRRFHVLKVAAAWAFIAVMLVPTIVLLMLAVPWLWDNPDVQAHLKAVVPAEIMPSRLARQNSELREAVQPEPLPSSWANDKGVCQVRVALLQEFSSSGNIVALSADVFDRLGLEADPWVEIVTPAGMRMGAMAIRKRAEPGTIYLRKTMAIALDLNRPQPAYVKVAPVELAYDLRGDNKLAFRQNRMLADAYCNAWFAAGVGLAVMEEANLTPGSYAIVKGPSGYQSVKLQVMDRGNPEEIWLSERVRSAIGVQRSTDVIILYPKKASSDEAAAAAPDEAMVALP